ncbi:MAG TPA: prepilin-type N-terminal cleavage/methylation domain-containing protein [Polyangiaceae bacterium]|jgi:prepilin-type N-terminal cleavage/methylation domain-containing protein
MQLLQFERGVWHKSAARGFTMAELMAVVAIVSILAVLATYSVRKYIATSKTSEAFEMITNIKAAQESYKDETFAYLPVSPDLTSDTSFYPSNPNPGQKKMNFSGAPPALQTNWQRLGVNSAGPVLFVYACTAGAAGTPPSPVGSDITIGNWPSTVGNPWYVVKAKADLSGQGVYTVFLGTSFSGDMFSANAN